MSTNRHIIVFLLNKEVHMPTVFCRGCGKEIHAAALHCPHSGTPQACLAARVRGFPWLAIVCLALAILSTLCALQVDSFDQDQIVGAGALASLELAAGAINLHKNGSSKGMASTAAVLPAVSLLVFIGS
jgi:hypothetical protein